MPNGSDIPGGEELQKVENPVSRLYSGKSPEHSTTNNCAWSAIMRNSNLDLPGRKKHLSSPEEVAVLAISRVELCKNVIVIHNFISFTRTMIFIGLTAALNSQNNFCNDSNMNLYFLSRNVDPPPPPPKDKPKKTTKHSQTGGVIHTGRHGKHT